MLGHFFMPLNSIMWPITLLPCHLCAILCTTNLTDMLIVILFDCTFHCSVLHPVVKLRTLHKVEGHSPSAQHKSTSEFYSTRFSQSNNSGRPLGVDVWLFVAVQLFSCKRKAEFSVIG